MAAPRCRPQTLEMSQIPSSSYMPHPIPHLDLQNISRIQPHPPPSLPLSSGPSQLYRDGRSAMAGPGRVGPRSADGWEAQPLPWSVKEESQPLAWPTSAGRGWGRGWGWGATSLLDTALSAQPRSQVTLPNSSGPVSLLPTTLGNEARVLTLTCRVSTPPRSLASSLFRDCLAYS